MRFIPKIKLSENVGFCKGVSNTVKIATDLLNKNDELFATGALIHNPAVMAGLYRSGLKLVDWENLPVNRKVLVQAHGISPRNLGLLREKGNDIIDGTCPIVKKSFDSIINLFEKNEVNFVFGNSKHPEMLALKGYLENITIVEKIEEIGTFEKMLSSANSVCISAQTTKSLNDFKNIGSEIIPYIKNFAILCINNTICSFTVQREREVLEKSCGSDVTVVIGGKNSSNTRKLYEIAKKNGKGSFHIDSKEEVASFENEIKKASKIFITSGTSTPIEQVNEIHEYILQIVGG